MYKFIHKCVQIPTYFLLSIAVLYTPVCFASTLTSPHRPSDLTTNLQGYWDCSEASGTRADGSGNGNTLTDNNTVGSVAEDYWDTGENSCDFESTNSEYLSITDGSQTGLDMTGNVSIAYWIKLESVGATQFVVTKNTAENYSAAINSSNNATFQVATGGVVSNSALVAGVWYHIVGVYDGSFESIYINGNLDGAVASTDNPVGNANDFIIGANASASGSFVDGFVKDVGIWSRALTPQEIKDLAFGVDSSVYGFRPDDSSLTSPVSRWKMNEIRTTGQVSAVDDIGSNTIDSSNGVGSDFGYIESIGRDFNGTNQTLSKSDAAQTGLDITGDITWMAWIYPDTISQQSIAGKTNSNGNQRGYNMQLQGGGGVRCLTSSDGISFDGDVTSTITLSANTWYHVACKVDGTTLSVHIDGVQDGTDITSGSIFNNTATFYVGANDGVSVANFFDGNISESAIWNVALSDANIASLASHHALQQSGMVSYYKLDEGSGAALDDIGSNDLTDNNTVGTSTGQVGSARDFERTNSEYFSITDGSQTDLDMTTDYSVYMWINLESTAITQEVLSKFVSNTGWALRINSSDKMEVQHAAGANVADTGTGLGSTTWTHIGYTYNDGSDLISYYFNSVSNSTPTQSTNTTDSTADFRIGATNSGADTLDGLLDEVVISDRDFKQDEVKAIYIKGNNAKELTSSENSPAGATRNRAVIIT